MIEMASVAFWMSNCFLFSFVLILGTKNSYMMPNLMNMRND